MNWRRPNRCVTFEVLTVSCGVANSRVAVCCVLMLHRSHGCRLMTSPTPRHVDTLCANSSEVFVLLHRAVRVVPCQLPLLYSPSCQHRPVVLLFHSHVCREGFTLQSCVCILPLLSQALPAVHSILLLLVLLVFCCCWYASYLPFCGARRSLQLLGFIQLEYDGPDSSRHSWAVNAPHVSLGLCPAVLPHVSGCST